MTLDLHYQLEGRGGRIWWIDKLGNRPWTDLAGFGIDLLPNNPNSTAYLSTFKGSFLISNKFHLNGSETLTVQVTMATAGFRVNNYEDVGFGLLLTGGKARYLLFAKRPDGIFRLGDMGPNPPFTFAPPTQPDVYSETPSTGAPAVILGGVDYSKRGQGSVTITSGCKAAAAEYQLLFGIFSGEPGPPDQPSALIVWSVDAT